MSCANENGGGTGQVEAEPVVVRVLVNAKSSDERELINRSQMERVRRNVVPASLLGEVGRDDRDGLQRGIGDARQDTVDELVNRDFDLIERGLALDANLAVAGIGAECELIPIRIVGAIERKSLVIGTAIEGRTRVVLAAAEPEFGRA